MALGLLGDTALILTTGSLPRHSKREHFSLLISPEGSYNQGFCVNIAPGALFTLICRHRDDSMTRMTCKKRA